MTIGKNSRKSSTRSSIRAPKFLDKSSGFYGRLDELEAAGGEEEVKGNDVEERRKETAVANSVVHISGVDEREEVGAFDLNEGMMEDDGETLLQRKPSRRSSRWRRSSRRKQKEQRAEEDAAQDERPDLGTEAPADPYGLEDTRLVIEVEMDNVKGEENEKAGRAKEPKLIQSPIREDADDQVLIRDKKRGRKEEGKQEREMLREQEEGLKVVKRNTVKNYSKALDRAFRRGWEAFITNLYSVTLTPVTSSSAPAPSPSPQKKPLHNSVLAEMK